jgi:hypothetical protein
MRRLVVVGLAINDVVQRLGGWGGVPKILVRIPNKSIGAANGLKKRFVFRVEYVLYFLHVNPERNDVHAHRIGWFQEVYRHFRAAPPKLGILLATAAQ